MVSINLPSPEPFVMADRFRNFKIPLTMFGIDEPLRATIQESRETLDYVIFYIAQEFREVEVLGRVRMYLLYIDHASPRRSRLRVSSYWVKFNEKADYKAAIGPYKSEDDLDEDGFSFYADEYDDLLKMLGEVGRVGVADTSIEVDSLQGYKRCLKIAEIAKTL